MRESHNARPSSSVKKHAWLPETAGHRMTTLVPVTSPDQTLQQVHDYVKREISTFKTLNYIYVLDEEHRLIGILSIKDLFRLPRDAKVGKACKRSPLVEMKPTTHQERAAYLALQHNIKAVPVVDHHHVFLGVVTADAILTILHKEMHEDILHLAGVHHPKALSANIFQLSLLESFGHRILWLSVGLFGGLLAAQIIGFFESTLTEHLILASFIPLIVYMSDAVGTQMEAYIIRDLAFTTDLPFVRYFTRQLLVVLMIAATFGLLLVLAGSFLHNARIGVVLGISLSAAIISSVFTGLLVPFSFKKLTMDPADASGPIATIAQDILSVVIYFTVASALL